MSNAVRGLAAAVIAALFFTWAATAAAQAPTNTIESLHEVLLSVMKQTGTARDRMAVLSPRLGVLFDYRRMSAAVAGSSWTEASETQRSAFVNAFAGLSAATYASRFKGYDGEKFEIVGSRDGSRGLVLVDTRIVPSGGEPVPLTYVLRQEGEKWQIVDVLLSKSISELAVRRSEYNAILRRSGIDGLIESLDQKTAALLGAS